MRKTKIYETNKSSFVWNSDEPTNQHLTQPQRHLQDSSSQSWWHIGIRMSGPHPMISWGGRAWGDPSISIVQSFPDDSSMQLRLRILLGIENYCQRQWGVTKGFSIGIDKVLGERQRRGVREWASWGVSKVSRSKEPWSWLLFRGSIT